MRPCELLNHSRKGVGARKSWPRYGGGSAGGVAGWCAPLVRDGGAVVFCCWWCGRRRRAQRIQGGGAGGGLPGGKKKKSGCDELTALRGVIAVCSDSRVNSLQSDVSAGERSRRDGGRVTGGLGSLVPLPPGTWCWRALANLPTCWHFDLPTFQLFDLLACWEVGGGRVVRVGCERRAER